MIVLGIVLLLLGILLGVGILYTLGLILIVIGAVLWIMGSMQRGVGGRQALLVAGGTSTALGGRVDGRFRSPSCPRQS